MQQLCKSSESFKFESRVIPDQEWNMNKYKVWVVKSGL